MDVTTREYAAAERKLKRASQELHSSESRALSVQRGIGKAEQKHDRRIERHTANLKEAAQRLREEKLIIKEIRSRRRQDPPQLRP